MSIFSLKDPKSKAQNAMPLVPPFSHLLFKSERLTSKKDQHNQELPCYMGILLTSSIVQYFLIFSAPNVSTS